MEATLRETDDKDHPSATGVPAPPSTHAKQRGMCMMGRLSIKNQMIIAIALVAVLALAFIFLAIVPKFQAAADLDAKIETESMNLSTAQALLARRQSAKAQSAANEAALLHIANQVPDSPQLPTVIIELQELANLADVSFHEVSPAGIVVPQVEAGAAAAEYSIVPISIITRGDWLDHIDFFHRLDRMDRGHRVAEVSFNYIEATDDEPAYVECAFTLEVYVMAAIAPSSPPPALPSGSTTESASSTTP